MIDGLIERIFFLFWLLVDFWMVLFGFILSIVVVCLFIRGVVIAIKTLVKWWKHLATLLIRRPRPFIEDGYEYRVVIVPGEDQT